MRGPSHPSRRPSVLFPRPALESVRLTLSDGAATTVQVARFERAHFEIRVVAIEPCSTVLRWCIENGAEHAIVGGFYLRPGGPPLGDLRIGGSVHPTRPFDPPWGERRACVHDRRTAGFYWLHGTNCPSNPRGTCSRRDRCSSPAGDR